MIIDFSNPGTIIFDNGKLRGLAEPVDSTDAATKAYVDSLTLTALLDDTTGIVVETSADTFTKRTLVAPASGITIDNPAGIAGNPTFALANDLGAIEALNTNGILTRIATDTWVSRTITGTTDRLAVSNGDGISGNPTLNISTSYIGQTSITTLGTITTGTWTGTTITAANGGTGLSNYTMGDLLYASASSTLSKLNDVATGNALISGGVGTAPSYGKITLTGHVSGILPIANGGTNLSTSGTANQILGMDSGTSLEYKTINAGNNISITHATNSITIDNYAARATVSTTTATPATILTIATATNITYLINVNIVARRTGGSNVIGSVGDSAAYVRTLKVKNVSGTVTISSALLTLTDEDSNLNTLAWDVTSSVSSTNVLIQVTGAGTTNINWCATYTVDSV